MRGSRSEADLVRATIAWLHEKSRQPETLAAEAKYLARSLARFANRLVWACPVQEFPEFDEHTENSDVEGPR